jgi:hypothetical protein
MASTSRSQTRSRNLDASSETTGLKITTTDGPFAETKEQLGGYFLIRARDLNEAIQIAAKIPSARFGSVEIRPVWA